MLKTSDLYNLFTNLTLTPNYLKPIIQMRTHPNISALLRLNITTIVNKIVIKLIGLIFGIYLF